MHLVQLIFLGRVWEVRAVRRVTGRRLCREAVSPGACPGVGRDGIMSIPRKFSTLPGSATPPRLITGRGERVLVPHGAGDVIHSRMLAVPARIALFACTHFQILSLRAGAAGLSRHPRAAGHAQILRAGCARTGVLPTGRVLRVFVWGRGGLRGTLGGEGRVASCGRAFVGSTTTLCVGKGEFLGGLLAEHDEEAREQHHAQDPEHDACNGP